MADKSKKGYRLIGLTGPTGSGKSLVSQVFSENGFAVVDADKVAHIAIESPVYKDGLISAFGLSILNSDGTVNRREVARIAFSTKENTARLNAIAHPVIIDFALEEFCRLCEQGYENIVFDAPTLIESGSHKLCDVIITVLAPVDIRKARIISRDNITEEEAKRRIDAQREDGFYTSVSHYVINNNGTKEQTILKTEEIIKELI